MNVTTDRTGTIKTALFVDFDNIYRGLDRLSPAAADRFARYPARWLTWLEDQIVNDSSALNSHKRSVLIRRCYLNPGTSGWSRHYFIRSAFSVIDCPFLTAQGKNSADIHMVMDILDTLDHKTNFDEFIILSGDSDFTPVLLRLRAHNRRTTILTVGQAVEAYKAAADHVINGDIFIKEALSISAGPPVNAAPLPSRTEATGRVDLPAAKPASSMEASTTLEEQMIAYVKQVVSHAATPVSLEAAASKLTSEYGAQIKETEWAGARSFKKLLLRANDLSLNIVTASNGTVYLYDPARHQSPDMKSPLPQAKEPAIDQPSLTLTPDQLRERIIAYVKQVVSEATEPVSMAAIASELARMYGGAQLKETKWGGAGSFKKLVQRTTGLGLNVATFPGSVVGYIYDPLRHQTPTLTTLPAAPQTSLQPELPSNPPPEAIPSVQPRVLTLDELRNSIVDDVRMIVAESNGPIKIAVIATQIVQKLGKQVKESEWAGEGSFKNLLYSVFGLGIEIATSAEPPGYIYDPRRHIAPGSDTQPDNFQNISPEIAAFARTTSRLTSMPYLTPGELAIVFKATASEIQRNPYNHRPTVAAVRTVCAEYGYAILSENISRILYGIKHSGYTFSEVPAPTTPLELAKAFMKNIVSLCNLALLELQVEEYKLLDAWILGGLDDQQLPLR